MSKYTVLPNELMYLGLAGTPLTDTEIKVLRCLAQGHTIQECADRSNRARETVKSQVRSARGRLQAKNTAHAIAIAVSLDLI